MSGHPGIRHGFRHSDASGYEASVFFRSDVYKRQVESALNQAALIEDMGYDNLVISIKASDVRMCARAHELIASRTDHPLHVGITEAGTLYSGNIKSAVGLGIILYQGIGDTVSCV